ncbi:MAG: aminotransferase class V-fold PLP-dependent enzyme, partial [Planctomycetes bacterium]|nr:aminotransferase class V-fold PLP-dependent enzyme [Planctomycetota bacterium]
GVTVRMVDIDPIDATLCMKSLAYQLGPKTRLVAVTAASNAVGSITDIPTIAKMVHEVGAELFVDAVHFAPHRRIDVYRWNCDYMVCSAYKFFGPHIGILYGRPQRMQELKPYKLRPSPELIPGRWMTGTQNHACIAGVTAAIDYLASLAGSGTSRREKLDIAFNDIVTLETQLIANLIEGLQRIPGVKVFGITDVDRLHERAPTVAFQIAGIKSADAAAALGEQGICGWHGNYYALPLTEALKTEPEGMIRLGCMHYNTKDEVARTLDVIQTIANAVA